MFSNVSHDMDLCERVCKDSRCQPWMKVVSCVFDLFVKSVYALYRLQKTQELWPTIGTCVTYCLFLICVVDKIMNIQIMIFWMTSPYNISEEDEGNRFL